MLLSQRTEGHLVDILHAGTRQPLGPRPRDRARPAVGSLLMMIAHRIFAASSRVLHISGLH